MLDISTSTIFIIRHSFDHNTDATRTKTFVNHFFELRTIIQFSGTAFDCAFNIIFGHVHGLGLVDEKPQIEIHPHISAAFASCDGNKLGVFGKHTTSHFILFSFSALDVVPFTMTRHIV
jgi:hypothetical protein